MTTLKYALKLTEVIQDRSEVDNLIANSPEISNYISKNASAQCSNWVTWMKLLGEELALTPIDASRVFLALCRTQKITPIGDYAVHPEIRESIRFLSDCQNFESVSFSSISDAFESISGCTKGQAYNIASLLFTMGLIAPWTFNDDSECVDNVRFADLGE